MALPHASSDQLRAAIRRFDDELRSQDEYTNWERNLRYRYAIESDGKRYPVKAIVSLATGIPTDGFKGGRSTNDYVSQRGFPVFELHANALHDSMESILATYAGARASEAFSAQAQVAKMFERARQLLSSKDLIEQYPTLKVQASYGRGNWANVPWIAFLDSRETKTTQRGVYPVILFRQDCSGLYLTLNQGVTEPKQRVGASAGLEELRHKARQLRTTEFAQSLAPVGFSLDDAIDLKADAGLGSDYEASTVAYKLYERGSVPSDADILRDVQALLDAYATYLGSPIQPANPPVVHLLLKWLTDRVPDDTIEQHKRIAEDKGSVWWGKRGPKGIDHRRLVQIREQLQAGIPTQVYLTAGDSFWVTTLHAITQSGKDVDPDRLPADYSVKDCKLFVRVSDFRPVPTEWFLAHAASDADNAVPGTAASALRSSVNPIYIQLTAPPPTASEGETIAPAPRITMDMLVEQTLLDRELLEEMVSTLQGNQRQIVLAGPPGTSKTFIAQCVAKYICQAVPDSYQLVQFHPSYSYESFVEGVKPVVQPSGGISFERKDGVVLDLVERMTKRGQIGASAPPYLLLIDEMNRANLPRVFGELMYLFEYREHPLRLPYSGNFSLPSNLGFIGTMNSADRSIRSIDAALRRRFEVFEFPPSPRILERYFAKEPLNVPNLIAGFEALNVELAATLDRHHTIGHAFFMKSGLTLHQLRAIWRRKILPLIEEYFFDQPDLAESFTLERFWPQAPA